MTNQVESFKLQSTLAAYRIVSPITATANTVQYPLTIGPSQPFFGATVNTVLDTTCAIAVKYAGIVSLYFNDTVTSGAPVTSDTSGRAIPYVPATAPSQFFGTLIGPSVAATATIADVLINVGFNISANNT